MCDSCACPAIVIIPRYSSGGGGLTSHSQCRSDNWRRLHHTPLEPVGGSRRLSPGLWRLGLHDQLRVDVSTSCHRRLPQHSQDLLPLRRPTHYPAAAACARDDRGKGLVEGVYSSLWATHHGAMQRHLPCGIRQCYLPPDTGECAPP